MPIKMLYWIGLLLYLSSVFVCVHGQPTSDLYNSDDNNGHQVAFMEQTLHTLLTMSTRLDSVESQLDTLQTMKVQLQSMENRLESVEKRQRSIGQWVQGNSRDTRCKWSVDGNRTCYKLVHEKMTWSESRTNCQNLGDGADLVSIESQEENEFLIEMIRELRQRGCSGILTSGRRDSSGEWSWRATGRPFNYTYWMAGEPSNWNDLEDICSFWDRPSVGLYWNDSQSTRRQCSLCEIP